MPSHLSPLSQGSAAAAALAALVLLTVPGRGAAPRTRAATQAALECRWTDVAVRIDGKTDDRAWKTAAAIDRFLIPGKAGQRPRMATKARLLWDRENLYFLAEMEDHDLYATVTEHDGETWRNDVFELFFKPADDKPGYYEFEINALNTVMDMFLPSRGSGGYERYVKDGEFHVESKVERRGTLDRRDDRDEGWTVEGRIPWSDFLRTGGRPEPGERWKMALCRYDYSGDLKNPELSSCAPLKIPSFHQYEDYASVQFVGPQGTAARRFGIERRVPLTTSTVVGSPDPPLPYHARRVYPKLKLTNPVTAAREPGSDRIVAIVQQWQGGPSKLVRFRDDPAVDTVETLLSLDYCAYDLVFHPDFAKNGFLYVGCKGPMAEPGEKRMVRVFRYTIGRQAPFALDASSQKTIIEWLSDGHDGAAMAFGLDGMFYVTSGDGTSDSDRNVAGQDMTRLLAKLLRLDVEHPDPGRSYSVPKDNPFVGMKDVRPETWAYGFRNPWRMTVDRKTGHVWVAQNGQDLWEQAFLIRKGANYGWSVYEGSHEFYPNRTLGPTPHVLPTVEHPHSEARSLTGGIVYYGERFPELRGAYVYGDYSTGKIWAVRHDGQRILWHKELADTPIQITGFAEDSHGEILICDDQGDSRGAFYTLEATPKDLPPSTFPRRLSESGLFRSVKGHVVQAGLIPYSVNAQLWSDGAYKQRYIALPGEDARIEFTGWRGWNFPERTVLVKSFALEREEGNPASRRWVETRFLTKQDGEWAGYSYLWNDAQTDATLVEDKGLDREYAVRVAKSAEHPDGVRKQVWHYPSRAECMVCHSRAANFVLGLTTLQMNKVHEYNGVRDNQLRVLEHLGVLKMDWNGEARNGLREEARARKLDENAYLEKQTASSGQREAGPSTLLMTAPEKYPHLVDPYDPHASLDARARSYLHANCANCHVEAGGGNAQMELEFTNQLKDMRILQVRPLHHTFELPDPRLVAAGSPDRSVLLHRIAMREKGQMPPLATSVVDRRAVELLTEWIRTLKPE